MIDKIERMGYKRKIKKLKQDNAELKRIVDRLNKRLNDSETNNEYLVEVLSENKQQATHLIPCEYCNSFAKMVKITKKEIIYYCERCKHYMFFMRV